MSRFSVKKAKEILKTQGQGAQFEYCFGFAEGNNKDADALACLGHYYHNAEEPERNLEKAETCYREAALSGCKAGREGLFALGCQYMYVTVSDDGNSITLEEEMDFPLDLEKAESIVLLCNQFEDARLSCFISQLFVWLGNYYRYGWNDTETDSKKALALYELVADSEDREIQYQYANFMADTVGDDAEAYKHYLLSVNQEFVPAMIRLSEFVSSNRDLLGRLSFKCLRKTPIPLLLSFFFMLVGSIDGAVVAGILAVQLPFWADFACKVSLLLGEVFFATTYLYVMISIYKSAAREIRKHVLLAELYLFVSLLLVNFFSKVLESAGFDSRYIGLISIGVPGALMITVVLILLYRRGRKRSFEWIQKAAKTGNVRGIYALAERYYYGIGVKKDREKAVEQYKLAARQGSNKAKIAMGHAYRFGRGVEKDCEKAYKYYLEAAEAGNADAQYMIGYCLEKGIGTIQDVDMKNAREWYQRGKENGSTLAKKRLNKPLYPTLRNHMKGTIPSYSDIENEKLRIKLEHKEHEVADKDRQIKYLEEQNRKLTDEIAGELKEGFKYVVKTLDELSTQLKTTNQELKQKVAEERKELGRSIDNASEALLRKFSEYCKIAEAATINKATANEDYRKQAEDRLKKKFEDTWDKLDKESQISLISARTLLSMLKDNQPKGTFDYSGIAICASSALENELIKHFFNEFIRILGEKQVPKKNWPEKLIQKEKDFTLGDFRFLINGDKEKWQAEGRKNRNMCLQEIMKTSHFHSDQPNKDLIYSLPGQSKSFVDLCDHIRREYRNPSAHAETVGEAKALSCCEWIMGRYNAEEKLNSTESVLILLFELLK